MRERRPDAGARKPRPLPLFCLRHRGRDEGHRPDTPRDPRPVPAGRSRRRRVRRGRGRRRRCPSQAMSSETSAQRSRAHSAPPTASPVGAGGRSCRPARGSHSPVRRGVDPEAEPPPPLGVKPPKDRVRQGLGNRPRISTSGETVL